MTRRLQCLRCSVDCHVARSSQVTARKDVEEQGGGSFKRGNVAREWISSAECEMRLRQARCQQEGETERDRARENGRARERKKEREKERDEAKKGKANDASVVGNEQKVCDRVREKRRAG